jgi:hypothetical protein
MTERRCAEAPPHRAGIEPLSLLAALALLRLNACIEEPRRHWKAGRCAPAL